MATTIPPTTSQATLAAATTPPTTSLPTQPLPVPRARLVLNGAPRPHPSARVRRNLWRIGLGLLLLAGIGWGVYAWFLRDRGIHDEITTAVRRADLPIIVSERGELESSKQTDVRCDVEGYQNKIVSILPEGKPVKKDEVVVTFDADQLKRQYADQEVKLKQAEGKAKASKGEFEVAKNKAETDIEKAKLDLTLADLDREKYIQGDYKVEVDDKKGALALAKRNLQESQEKLEHSRSLHRKGFIPLEQLRLKEADLAQKEYEVSRDEAKLMVLERFTKKRQEAELTAKAAEAKRALQRAKSTGQASTDKSKSDLDAAEVTARLEQATLAALQRQLDHCTVKAPQDGILVYSKERWYDDSSRIQAGAMVHFRQGLFSLPDLSHMQMKLKVHESMVKKVKVGHKAEMRLESNAALVLHGTVKSVATLASMDGWFDRTVKEYETIIQIDDLPLDAGLKPGMTGDAKILVNYLPNVLIVPVQSVSQREGKYCCYVSSKNGIEVREVEVGENNDKFVEIKSGLEEGERVTLDARARVAAELKAKESKPDQLPQGFGTEQKPAEKQEPKAPAPQPQTTPSPQPSAARKAP